MSELDTPEKPKRPVGRPKGTQRRPDATVIVQGNFEWKVWVDRFAVSEDASLSDLIASALAELARKRKFEPPPVRITRSGR